jgi:anaerobic magnesium-protoporphyrin IX monomethyl ester cyclase
MKITLIQPKKPSFGAEAEKHWELTRPFSLFFLAASLKKYTPFDVQIVDLERKQFRNLTLDDVFKDDNSNIYGITATTFTRHEAIKVAQYLRNAYPSSFIIVGGVHFMYSAEDTLKNIAEIDCVVRGEGELTIVTLANAIHSEHNWQTIKGITYRSNGNIIHNDNQKQFEDLDSLPFYSEFSWDDYQEYLMGYPDKIPATSVMSSRGCPYRCIFCSKAGMKYRLRDPIKVVDEIQLLKEKFKIQGINFLDLTFTANINHARAICNELINRRLNLKWWCESRANIPLDLLDLMKQAGCVSIVVGVESGSPNILSKISKDITVEQVINFVKKCSEIGLIIKPYFMFSFPGESFEDVTQTLALISKLEKYSEACSFQPTIIFPGTEIERFAYSSGLLPKDFSWTDEYYSDLNRDLGQMLNIPIFMDKLSPDDLKQINLKRIVNRAANMKIKDLIIKAVQSKVVRKYALSPKLLYKYLIAKMKIQ